MNIVVCRFVHIFMPIKGKQVRFLHGPPLWWGDSSDYCHWETGKAWRVDEPKSEDLPADNTPETLRAIGEVYDLRNCKRTAAS